MRHLLALALLLAAAPALADVLPLEAMHAEQRFREYPKAYDRTDQWCEGKRLGAACALPGTPLQGGGAGTCARRIATPGYTIDLVCRRDEEPRVDYALPHGPWQGDEQICSRPDNPEYQQALRNENAGCTPPAPAHDRFCRDKAAGEACTVELTLGERRLQEAGVCTASTQTQRYYFQGHREVSRPVVLCSPPASAPAPRYAPVGFWRKLFP